MRTAASAQYNRNDRHNAMMLPTCNPTMQSHNAILQCVPKRTMRCHDAIHTMRSAQWNLHDETRKTESAQSNEHWNPHDGAGWNA